VDTQIRLFLSYAREDESSVQAIYNRLHDEGFIPWMERKNLLPGEVWEVAIESAIRSSDLFLLFLSSNSVTKRGFLQKEVSTALDILKEKLDRDIYLIPIRLEVCEVPERIQHLHYLDIFKEESWAVLVNAIQAGAIRRAQGIHPVVQETRQAESPLSWEIEIRRILNSEVDSDITMLGSVGEYIEAILAEAPHPPSAQAAFHEALRNIVYSWQPSVSDSSSFLNYMFDLLGAYTPSLGFNKVLSLLQLYLSSPEKDFLSSDSSEENNLVLKAFSVLENYYPVAPLNSEELAFRTYINLLREFLSYPQSSSYAIERLIELEVLRPQDQAVVDLLSKNPQWLSQIVRLLLAPTRRSRAEEELTGLYINCLKNGKGLDMEFEQAVLANGAEFQDRDSGPAIHSSSELIQLPLPYEIIDLYYERRLVRQSTEAVKIFQSLPE
jgi:hypothetical protein